MKACMATVLLAALAVGARGQGVIRDSPVPPPASTDPPGSLSGRVVNAITGEPVRHAMVVLQNLSRGVNYQSTTDGAGTFSAGNLPPGDYLVQVSHPTYPGMLGIQGQSQTVKVVSAEQSSGVTLRLMPGGTIIGKVLDDGGEPVSGCAISALGPSRSGDLAAFVLKGNATTNDKGEYKFDALMADRYLIYALCQESLAVERRLAVWHPELIEPTESWLPIYYPDNPSPVGAQWLTALPGSELSGIDFKLRSTPVTTVSGTLVGIPSGASGNQPNIMLLPYDGAVDASLAYSASFDALNSTFRCVTVPPGSYRLMAISYPGPMESLSYASVPVTVGSVRSAPLLVQMRPGLTVTGVVELPPPDSGGTASTVGLAPTLQVTGRQPPKEPQIGNLNLYPLSQMSNLGMRQVELHADGAFTVQGLTPGRYRVEVQVWAPKQASLESVQFGSTRSDKGLIELSDASSGTLRVRTVAGSAQISVSLADAPSGVHGDWWIFAVSADEPVGPANQPVSVIGKSGSTVQLQVARAGKFMFIAVEMAVAAAIQNERLARLLRERVDPVEVVAGQDQTVKPTFFTSADIEKLALAYLRGETR